MFTSRHQDTARLTSVSVAGEHVEYNKTTDKGVGVTFWRLGSVSDSLKGPGARNVMNCFSQIFLLNHAGVRESSCTDESASAQTVDFRYVDTLIGFVGLLGLPCNRKACDRTSCIAWEP